MAATDVVKDGLEGYLYYSMDEDATYEAGTGTESNWTLIGYVSGFNYSENDNSRPVYDHYTVDHFKRGRENNSGSINHLYTNKTKSVLALKGVTVALKLEIRDNGGATCTEAHILNKVRVGEIGFNMPDQGDISASASFTYSTSNVVEPPVTP